jgi:hypothetical protein
LKRTIATASLRTLSPKTREYSKGSARIFSSPKIDRVATGSTDEIRAPNIKLYQNKIRKKPFSTSKSHHSEGLLAFKGTMPILAIPNNAKPIPKVETTVPKIAKSIMVEKFRKKSRFFKECPASKIIAGKMTKKKTEGSNEIYEISSSPKKVRKMPITNPKSIEAQL